MRSVPTQLIVVIAVGALLVSCGRKDMAMAPPTESVDEAEYPSNSADKAAAHQDMKKEAQFEREASADPSPEPTTGSSSTKSGYFKLDDRVGGVAGPAGAVAGRARLDTGGGSGSTVVVDSPSKDYPASARRTRRPKPRPSYAPGSEATPTTPVVKSPAPPPGVIDIEELTIEGRVAKPEIAKIAIAEEETEKEEEYDIEPDEPAADKPRDRRERKKGAKGKAERKARTITLDGLVLDNDEDDDREAFGREREQVADPYRYQKPDAFLARQLYFENTYLGGAAGYLERLRRLDTALSADQRPYRLAHNYTQPFDAPDRAGLKVTAQVDTPSLEQPQRVFLQVGLQGSQRYGWRRPPLDVVLVLDRPVLAANPDVALRMVMDLVRKLDNADRLAVLVAGKETRVVSALSPLRVAQRTLAKKLQGLIDPGYAAPIALSNAMQRAAELLSESATQSSKVPGTQTVLVLTQGNETTRIGPATVRAHELTVQGAVTSVIELDGAERGAWWQVANAGHGNYHRIGASTDHDAIGDELESLARVVARLVRVNIRLGKHAKAVRILGTRVLDEEETRRVKAREVATDKNLSRTMGIKADRGDDDDGLQTVIPYFYGDDSHVILVELWVDGPGTVADVTVRYKDMVDLKNATGRTSVKLTTRPQPANPEQLAVQRNVRGFKLGELLQRASHRVRHWDRDGALSYISEAKNLAAATSVKDRRMLQGFQNLLSSSSFNDAQHRAAVSESLLVAGQRKVGEPAPLR